MPAEHAEKIINAMIDRILSGEGNAETLSEAAAKRDRHYFRQAISRYVYELEDDKDEALRQRNVFAGKLSRLRPLIVALADALAVTE